LIEPDERKSALVHVRLAKARSPDERRASGIVPARSSPLLERGRQHRKWSDVVASATKPVASDKCPSWI
jgi:hypothetical protein